MMNLLFDLDGTLTDPGEGIAKSMNHALGKFGLPSRERSYLERFIGPPLPETFRVLLGTEDAQTFAQAIAWFRERYFVEGYLENRVYAGVRELLSSCEESGHRLFVATRKRQGIAEKVLTHFELASSFAAVYGCDLHLTKTELLAQILHEHGLAPKSCVMIGDRSDDMHAGRHNGMFTIGVLWGYGTVDELAAAPADYLVHTPPELLETIRQLDERTAPRE